MRYFLLFCALITTIFLAPARLLAADSLCASVKIEINQELTLERQAFDAHMRINNGLSNITLENVNVNVVFKDKDGISIEASSDPNNTTAKFFIRLDTMDNIDNVSGSGRVNPSTSADIHWLIIPVPGSANGNPAGTLYYVGASLSYTMGGEQHDMEVTPDYIYVKPMPELTLDYFLPKDVYGDDAFTGEIEPSIPFPLGVRVKNDGYGIAHNLKIESAQPKIVDNAQGLLVGFVIEKCEVNGQPSNTSLLADFGQIDPGLSKIAKWIMKCSLSGKFIDFKASFSHSDELGGELTSLIRSVNAHSLVRDVLIDIPGSDNNPDFLAIDTGTYRVYNSENADAPVLDQSANASLQPDGQPGSMNYNLNAPQTSGFMFVKLSDPYSGAKDLKEVVRSDGKQIKAENAWLSKIRNPDSKQWEYYVNLFDVSTTPSYHFVFGDPQSGPQPPVMQFIPDRSVAETAQISFIVEATNQDGTKPALSAQALPVGASFTDNHDGTGSFSWIPSQGQSGRYELTFTAANGTLTDHKKCAITVNSYWDTDGDGMADNWEMQYFGTLARDGTGDYDNDGVSDYREYVNGTNPVTGKPPATPVVNSPENGGVVSNLTPAISVLNSADPQGDTITYGFELYSDEQYSNLIVSTSGVMETETATGFNVAGSLNDNATYYWRARATDGGEFSHWNYSKFFVRVSTPPARNFYVSAPKDGSKISTLTPLVEVTNTSDPDNAGLSYAFNVYSDKDMQSLVSSGTVSQGLGGITQWQAPSGLMDNTSYYISVSCLDTNGQAVGGAEVLSFRVNTQNEPPSVPVAKNPGDKTWSTKTAAVISVIPSADPENNSITYDYEIYFSTPSNHNMEPSGLAAQAQGKNANWVAPALLDGDWYFWRARAVDEHGAASEWSQLSAVFVKDSGISALPDISFSKPEHGIYVNTGNVTLEWQDTHPEDIANISLFYVNDSTSTGINGTEIVSNIQEGAGTNIGTYSWDISGLPAGIYFVYGIISDENGSSRNYCQYSITIDKTSPAVSAAPAGGVYLQPQNVTITASEQGDTYYTIDGTTPTVASTRYTGSLGITAPGAMLSFVAVDLAGNISPVMRESYAILTETATNLNLTDNPAWSTNNAPTWAWSQPQGSLPEIAGYVYSIDGGSGTFTAQTAYTSTPLPDGQHTFSVKVKFNTTPVTYGHANTDNFGIDTTPPQVVSVSINGGDIASDNPAVSVIVQDNNDSNGSGVYLIQASIDNGAYFTFTGAQLTLPGVYGEHSVSVIEIDNVGLVSEVKTAGIILSPSLNTISGASLNGTSAVLQDLRSGISYSASISTGAFSFTKLPPGIYGLLVKNSAGFCVYPGRISLYDGTNYNAGALEIPGNFGSINGRLEPSVADTDVLLGIDFGQGCFLEIQNILPSNGTFSINNVNPGTYAIKATPPASAGYAQLIKTFNVQAAANTDVSLGLRQGYNVSGQINYGNALINALGEYGGFYIGAGQAGQYSMALSSGSYALYSRSNFLYADPFALTLINTPLIRNITLNGIDASQKGTLANGDIILAQDAEAGIAKSLQMFSFNSVFGATKLPEAEFISDEIQTTGPNSSFNLYQSTSPENNRLLCVVADDLNSGIHSINAAHSSLLGENAYGILSAGGKISGKVNKCFTQTAEKPVVLLINSSDEAIGVCEGGPDGSYFFKNVAPGQGYKLKAFLQDAGESREYGPFNMAQGQVLDNVNLNVGIVPTIEIANYPVQGLAGQTMTAGIKWSDLPDSGDYHIILQLEDTTRNNIVEGNAALETFESSGTASLSLYVDADAVEGQQYRLSAYCVSKASGTNDVVAAYHTSPDIRIVKDVMPPVLTVPANRIVEAVSVNGTSVQLTATAVDDHDPSPMVTSDAPEVFQLGATLVTFMAMDNAGNVAVASMTVTVVDTIPPQLAVPADIIKEATGENTLVDLGQATATDIFSVSILNDAPSSFKLGVTTVTWTATDLNLNKSVKTQKVTIVDTSKPVITVSGVENGAWYKENIIPGITITDTGTGIDSTTVLLDGQPYSIGSSISDEARHILYVAASDKSGNIDSKTFSFAVDKTAPQITIASPQGGEIFSVTISTITIYYQVTDNLDTALQAAGFLTNLISGTSVQVSNGQVIDPAAIADGNWALTVQSTDKAGNSSISTAGSFRVNHDIYAPAQITALYATEVTTSSVTLSWIAPGNDGSVGNIAIGEYRLKYSNNAPDADINAWWNVAPGGTSWTQGITPGTQDTSFIDGLVPGSTYWFALKTGDEMGNWSGVSNVCTVAIPVPMPQEDAIIVKYQPEYQPPAAITCLSVYEVDLSSITLSWIAPGENGVTGDINSGEYWIKYSDTAPVSGINNWWNASVSELRRTMNTTPFRFETADITGLVSGKTYYFAIKTKDGSNNWSDISNISTGTTVVPLPQEDNILLKYIPEYQPPAVINNISFYSIGQSSVTLAWTAPGDNGLTGDITDGKYQIDYSPVLDFTSPFSFVWSTSTKSGNLESRIITGLTAGSAYYFRIRTRDGSNNWADWSNIFSTSTLLYSTKSQDNTVSVVSNLPVEILNVSTASPNVSFALAGASGQHLVPIGPLYDITPEGTVFTVPAMVKYYYDPAAVPEISSLAIYKWTGSVWSKDLITGQVVHSAEVPPYVTGDIHSLSLYGLFIVDNTSPTVTVSGVLNGSYSRTDIAPVINVSDNIRLGGYAILLNGASFNSGAVISQDNSYSLSITAWDSVGNTTSHVVDFVIDKISPEIEVSGITNNGNYNTPVTLVVSVNDANPGVLSLSLNGQPYSNGTEISGEGSYSLDINARDMAGNISSATMHFNIDTIPPALIPAQDLIVEATGIETPVDIGNAIVTDSATVTITNNAPLEFMLGITTVTWTAVDAVGNTSTAYQIITIVDTTPPALDVPANVTSEATGVNTPIAIGEATATDIFGATITNDAPAEYPLGLTVVTWTAADGNGNTAIKTQQIIVRDTTVPLLSVPADINTEAMSLETIVNIGNATATDIFEVTIANNSPSAFGLGTTVVTWTATDANGNISTGIQRITVVDATPPELTVPADIITEATGTETPVSIGNASATDIFNVSITDNAPSVFRLGITTVTWTATDASGNVSIGAQHITIIDTTLPTLEVPADITTEATGTRTVVETGQATATDIFGVTVTNDAPADYPLGLTVVTWRVTDGNNNVTTKTQQVTVRDTTTPLLSVPADIIAEATGIETSVSIGNATATDIFAVTITNNAPVAFGLGVTTVTWTATDANGNISTGIQRVTVADNTAPVLSVPSDVTAEATGIQTLVGIGNGTATDIFEVTITNNAPSTFGLGVTTVIWTATDANGNVSTGMQRITVADNTAPVLSMPADVTVEATGIQTPVSIGNSTATDIFGVTITNNAPAAFGLGVTTVTWIATDANGNVSTGIQRVTVADNTAPVLSVPTDVTAEATGIQTVVNIGNAVATDIFEVTITNDAPVAFGSGVTTVKWTATDANGNVSTGVQHITVRDTTPPVLDVPMDITSEATGIKTQVNIGEATATDIFGVTVTNDAPADYPLGLTVVAWRAVDGNNNVTTKTQNINVRDTIAPLLSVPADKTAEATGVETIVNIGNATATDVFEVTITNDAPAAFGLGVTTVTWTATDANGNVSTGIQRVTVADNTAPVLSVPSDVTAEATGIQTPVSIGNATATDIFGVTITNNAPSAYVIGVTTVTWTATDSNGNVSTNVQHITVRDTLPPALSVPSDVTAEAAGTTTQVNIGNATATDIFGVTITNNAPVAFSLGVTTVAWTATDANGNVSTGVQHITAKDTTPPALDIPADVVYEAIGVNSPINIGQATATDIFGVTVTNDAPADYPLGLTVVTWRAVDGNNNVTTETQNVTVRDTIAPLLSVPADKIAEATGVGTIVNIGNATATDVFEVTITNDAPATFGLGVTTVTWTATDANGNVSTGIQRITVTDNIAPVLSVPADVTAEATGIQTPVVIGNATATDIFEVTITNNAPVAFGLGVTTVTWTAIDANGNVSTGIQRITVADNTAPIISVPTDISTEATSIQTPVVIGNATATDIFDVTITNDAPAAFGLGVTTVIWTATDSNRNVSTGVQRITVADNTAPVLSVPADVTTEATDIQTLVSIGNATATDIFGVTITNDAPASFGLGVTTVTWTATDANGKVSTGMQRITVADNTAPVLSVPSNVTAEATGIQTPVIIGNATATDIFEVTITNNAPSAYGLGVTTVTWTAIDVNGNVSIDIQLVTVADTVIPQIIITGVEDGNYYNSNITPLVSVEDILLDNYTITLNGDPFVSGTVVNSEGNYLLAVNAADTSNNTAGKSISFAVDKTMPVITVSGVTNNGVYNTPVTPVITISDTNLNSTLTTIKLNGADFTSGAGVTGNGTYTLYVKAVDKAGNFKESSIGFMIHLNVAPVASNVSASINEDTQVNITLTATDANNDPLAYAIVSGPTHGSVTLNGNVATYTPGANYNGNDSFTFKANDGEFDSNIAAVNIAITAVNDAPIASNAQATTQQNMPVNITLTATDVDMDSLMYLFVTPPANGSVTISGNTVVYTPNAGYTGNDSFTFKANDGTVDSNVAAVSVTVTSSVNTAPVAYSAGVQTGQGTPITVVLQAADAENDPLTFRIVRWPHHGTVVLSGNTAIYTPFGHFIGEDSFTFRSNDGKLDSNTAKITITVNRVNHAPVAKDIARKVFEDRPLHVRLFATDADRDRLTYSIVTGPQHGKALLIGAIATYIPDRNFHGVDSFTYKANDDEMDSNIATVTITVLSRNDRPNVSDGGVVTTEDTQVSIQLEGTDPEDGSLTYFISKQPRYGNVIISGNVAVYTPDANFNGKDSFMFRASDGERNSFPAEISVTVTPINDAPQTFDIQESVKKNRSERISLRAYDVDNFRLTYVIVNGPSHGTAVLWGGDVIYTPHHNYKGADSFTYKANDGSVDSNTAVVSILVK